VASPIPVVLVGALPTVAAVSMADSDELVADLLDLLPLTYSYGSGSVLLLNEELYQAFKASTRSCTWAASTATNRAAAGCGPPWRHVALHAGDYGGRAPRRFVKPRACARGVGHLVGDGLPPKRVTG
jgi:hypothetical protein